MSLRRVKLAFLGDIYLGEQSHFVNEEVCSYLKSCDLVFANLESPMTDPTSTPLRKGLNLRAEIDNLVFLHKLSISAVSIANNHICDWGKEGLQNTLIALEKDQISHVGAGLTPDQANAPLCFSIGGVRIGIIACGEENIQTVSATKNGYGCSCFEPDQINLRIKELRKKVDFVCLQIHWGLTNYHYPLPEQIQIAHRLIEGGVDLIIGHHPHVIQGFEQYTDKYIVYSLGNFFFGPYYRNKKMVRLSGENYTSMIAIVEVGEKNSYTLRFVHTRQLSPAGPVVLLSKRKRRRREMFLEKLCNPLCQNNYPLFFKKYVLRRLIWRFIRWMNPANWKNFSKDYFLGLKVAFRRLIQ